ncbi:uncharacterized protein LOC102212735 [Pundamilia nyererei]|uniref:Uncharacterized protein LOC102212735 n=1 Tax=Pundamilia nyererei TaxID=303518 RepID=A0A9Y3VKF0_9CICH|nr:PREDICTED: uncharacterized protein LOC102212735 [Pundamilia nyererei]
MVRPGENITLYCDCKTSTGEFIVWYRNCSHEKQPSLVLKTKLEQRQYKPGIDYQNLLNPLPNFHLVKNHSSQSYDLLITNITDSDEGFYYCGTEQSKVKDKETINLECLYRYGNLTTKILLHPREPQTTQKDCGICWMLLFSLCPAFVALSSLLCSLLIYYHHKTAKKPLADEKRYESRDQMRRNQNEDVCYAALEIQPVSQRPKKRIAQSSDFSAYTTMNSFHM